MKSPGFFTRRWFDLLCGGSAIVGALVGGLAAPSLPGVGTEVGAAVGSAVFWGAALLAGDRFRPRYLIDARTLPVLFEEKLRTDIKRFTDSNTSMDGALSRIHSHVAYMLEALECDEVFANDEGFEQLKGWLGQVDASEISFKLVSDRRPPDVLFPQLVDKVRSALCARELRVNSSVVEPGCVALVEFLRGFGLPIYHEFTDINGMEQVRTLSGEREFDVSFVPISTVVLCFDRSSIVDRYRFICPVTSEDQRILSSRDHLGRFCLEQVTVPERGSGHFQILAMRGEGSLSACEVSAVDLAKFQTDPGDTVVLFEPVASVVREVYRADYDYDFVTSTGFDVDIVLLANADALGEALIPLRQLVVAAMAAIKRLPDVDKRRMARRLYRQQGIREAFETANGHFARIMEGRAQ